jgi:DNA-binding PucR family transcriptional regulator
MTPEEIVAFVEQLAAASGGDVEKTLRLAAAALAERSKNGRALRYGFWQRLADGAWAEEPSIREEASMAGLQLAPSYVCVVLECEDPTDTAQVTETHRAAREIFSSTAGELGEVERESTIEFFIPAAREVDASRARTAAALIPKTLAKRHAALRISGGASGPGTSVEAPAHMRRARAALAIGRRIFGPGRVSLYDDLGAYAMLYGGATVDELRAFAARILQPLRRYDEKHQTELERTLRLYFSLGQNVKTAAAQLNVHRHTVFYRLRQIAEICGCDLGGPHDQLTLRLALAIDALHS